MNSIIQVENIKKKKVFIFINHIKFIFEIYCSDGIYYNVVCGDNEENFITVDEKNFNKILTFCNKD